MSFDDISAKMKARKAKQKATQQAEETSYDFEESYRIRAKMLGVLLRDARQAVARTIEDCARLLRVNPSQIEAWEYGDEAPSLPQLELLAYYLDVPISHFYGAETLKASRADKETMQPEYIRLRNRMVGAKLRQAREEAGITLEALAETSAISTERLQAYEMGEVAPPMHELSVLAGGVDKNIGYFQETNGQIGELLAMRENWKHFADLPEDVREFASNPTNIGFIHIALMFSQMPSDRLREVGASILDITM
jgi:transcriptional regulator with XRE-family HTH domain